jgi:hypothetical protein
VESIRIALRIMENSYKKSPHFNCFGGWRCVYPFTVGDSLIIRGIYI